MTALSSKPQEHKEIINKALGQIKLLHYTFKASALDIEGIMDNFDPIKIRRTLPFPGALKMETIRSPKHLFQIVLHGTKPQKTCIILTLVLLPNSRDWSSNIIMSAL
jgi:hypothetical protein